MGKTKWHTCLFTKFLFSYFIPFIRRAPLTYAIDSQLLSNSPRKEEREEREPITAHQLDLARQIDGVCKKNKNRLTGLSIQFFSQVRGALQELVTSSSLLPSLLDLCKALAPVLESGARASAPLGAMTRYPKLLFGSSPTMILIFVKFPYYQKISTIQCNCNTGCL